MVDAIAQADASPLFTDAEKALIAAATELTNTASLSEEAFARARAWFEERALLELVINTSLANLNNRVTDAFVADVQDEE